MWMNIFHNLMYLGDLLDGAKYCAAYHKAQGSKMPYWAIMWQVLVQDLISPPIM